MTEQETARLMTLIAGAFPEVSEGGAMAIKSWYIALADLEYSEAARATVLVLQRSRFKPRPADIREAVADMVEVTIPAAEDAWEEVNRQLDPYKTPTWSHPLVERAVRNVGFLNLLHSTRPELSRKNFIEVYNTLLQRGNKQAATERANAAIGMVSKILIGRGA